LVTIGRPQCSALLKKGFDPKSDFYCQPQLIGYCFSHKAGHHCEEKMAGSGKKEAPKMRQENPIFTIWVHAGYIVLILSVIGWMVYMEFIM